MPTHPRPWHRGSLFGDGPRRPLDREQRARFRFLLNAHRRAHRITPLGEMVGNALVRRLSVEGQLDPSHDTLAADAGCSARTVRRATATMRSLGLLRWQCRLVRDGWRCAQTSNAYELVPTAATPVISCGGQRVRESRSTAISPMSAASPAALEAAQKALERRRAVVEARLLNKG